MWFYKPYSVFKLVLLGLVSLPLLSYAQPQNKPELTSKQVPHPFPLPSEVSYESLRIMAHSGQSLEAIKLAEQYLKYRENSAIRTLLARMLAWNKQYDQARTNLQIVLKKHPADYDASDTLADVEMWDGHYDTAIQALQSALKYDPDDVYLNNKKTLIQAKQYYANNKISDAIKLLEERLKQQNAPDLRMYLASIYHFQRDFKSEKNQYESILKINPNNNDAKLELVKTEIALGNKKNALTLLDSYLSSSPDNSSFIQIKNELISQNKTSDTTTEPTNEASNQKLTTQPAADIKTTAIQSVAKDDTYEKIKALEKKGRRMQAIQVAKDYLKTNDNNDIRVYLGSMLIWDEKDKEAREQLNIVLNKSPGHVDASIALANLELREKNYKDAIKVLDSAIKQHPTNTDLITLKKRAEASNKITYDQLKTMENNNQRDKAILLAKEYLSKSENGDIRLLLAYMQLRDGDNIDAESNFKIVLKNSPRYADASIGLSKAQSNLGDSAQAIVTINNALKYKPNDASLLESRAQLIQSINQNGLTSGMYTLYRRGTGYVPTGLNDKLNSLGISQEIDEVSDLQQKWKMFSLQYTRVTSLGSIIATINKADRFRQRGTQYLLEAYPYLFSGAYAYLGYGYSETSYFPKNYIGFEPFFNLPMAFELSVGERILQFQTTTTHLYTGSIAKYYGNYWIAFRPYISGLNSRSYYFIIRRFFSNPENYITLRVGTGKGPSTITDPTSINANKSRTINLSGQYQICDDLIIDLGAGYSYEHFPNARIRRTNSMNAGLTWLF